MKKKKRKKEKEKTEGHGDIKTGGPAPAGSRRMSDSTTLEQSSRGSGILREGGIRVYSQGKKGTSTMEH